MLGVGDVRLSIITVSCHITLVRTVEYVLDGFGMGSVALGRLSGRGGTRRVGLAPDDLRAIEEKSLHERMLTEGGWSGR